MAKRVQDRSAMVAKDVELASFCCEEAGSLAKAAVDGCLERIMQLEDALWFYAYGNGERGERRGLAYRRAIAADAGKVARKALRGYLRR